MSSGAAKQRIGQGAPVSGMRNCWYPICFAEDLPLDEPYGLSVCGVPVVVWLHKGKDLVAALDVCPHRSAPLSLGRVVDGVLECKYHGWQFGSTDGKCTYVPSDPDKKNFLAAQHAKTLPAMIRYDCVWVYLPEDDQLDSAGSINLGDAAQAFPDFLFRFYNDKKVS